MRDAYRHVAARATTVDEWGTRIEAAVVPAWLGSYRAATSWEPEVLQIDHGELTFLFDAAPTLRGAQAPAEDRVLAVWGRSAATSRPRDNRRLRGFLPLSAVWSLRGRDRGHFVAHACGGGLDINLFPQSADLNRGLSREGRRWRAMERFAARHPGTPLFVRPLYETPTWAPTAIDYGLLIDGHLEYERFAN